MRRAAVGLYCPTEPSAVAGRTVCSGLARGFWQPLRFLFLSLHPALFQFDWWSWTLESLLFPSSGNTQGSLALHLYPLSS